MGPAKFLLNIYGHRRRPRYLCGTQRTTYTRSQFSSSTIWVPGIKLRASLLGTSTFILYTILLAPTFLYKEEPFFEGHIQTVLYMPSILQLQICNFREQATKYDPHTYCNLKSNHDTFENPKEHVLWIQEDGFGFNHKNQSGSPHRTILSQQLQPRSKQRLKQSTLFHTEHPPGPELQAAMRCLKWVLGTNSRLLKEQYTLKSQNHLASSESTGFKKKLRLCDSLPVFFYAR